MLMKLFRRMIGWAVLGSEIGSEDGGICTVACQTKNHETHLTFLVAPSYRQKTKHHTNNMHRYVCIMYVCDDGGFDRLSPDPHFDANRYCYRSFNFLLDAS